ncbi:MAG: hypothetical protein AAFO81_12125 [Pseudomonadota bacterium]
MRTLTYLASALLLAALAAAGQADSPATERQQWVVVNGTELTQDEIRALRQRYGTVYSGRFWYDPLSGMYGQVGEPPMGQLDAGMRVGGALSAAASGGGSGRLTGVFINGREAHPREVQFYRQVFGRVLPGRYWMNADGIGGFERMPASFNLKQAMAQSARRSRGGGSVFMDWIGGKPGTHVGRASDGCIYISQGGYSSESC